MKKGIFAKSKGKSFRRFLYRTVCILFALTALTAWSVSGVYAKYVDSVSAKDSAGIASMGIVTFRLLEHKAEPIDDDKLQDMLDLDRLYELDFTEEVLQNTYSKVIPGVDIPKDPFIELEFADNEVSYELYVVIEKSENFPEYVTFEMADGWEKVEPETEDGEPETEGSATSANKVTYKYKEVFVAGKTYAPFKYDAVKDKDTSIHILKDDKLTVSQYFNSEPNEKGEATEFSITFTAYLQQIINIPEGDTEVEDGD